MTLVKSLKQFDTYIKGGSVKSLKRHMKYYNNRIDLLNSHFKSILIDDASIHDEIESLLTNLGIPKKQWNKYFGHELTVYDLLLELSQAGYMQIAQIVRIIDRKEKVSRMAIALGIIVPVAFAGTILTTPPLESTLAALQAFFMSTESLPILGMIKTTLFSAYNLYQIFSDKTQPLSNRWRDAAFVLIKAAVSYVGYALWMASAVSMTPVVAALFVASTFLDLGRQVFCLVQELAQYRKTPVGDDVDDLNINRNHVRHEIGYKKHLNAAIINLVTAVAIVGIMAAWTFAPGGIVVILASLAALAVVYGVQYLALRHNEHAMRDELQKELRCIEADNCVLECDNEFELREIPSHVSKNDIHVTLEPESGRPASSQRQSKTPAARSLPFFQVDKPIEKTEDFTTTPALVS